MTNKDQIIKWLNIFLLVINISAFTSFLLMNNHKSIEHDDRFSTDEFLRSELDLTDEQFTKISSLNSNIFRSYQALLDKKCELNFELITELSDDMPNEEVLDSLTKKIGHMDELIKKQTVKHFQNVRSICNNEQKELLEQLLKDMMEAGNQCKYCNKIKCSRRDQLEKK